MTEPHLLTRRSILAGIAPVALMASMISTPQTSPGAERSRGQEPVDPYPVTTRRRRVGVL